MLPYINELSQEEQEKLQEMIRRLFRQTFLLERKYDKKAGRMVADKDFYFADRHMDFLKDYFAAAGICLEQNTELGTILDSETGKGLCVVDLDTVMPGLALNDFGDSIRFGASTAEEDEPDLSKVWLDLSLFESYTKGFLKACGDSLTEKELDMLPMGAKIMTLECGIRFLTDYIQGDTYFRISREGQNLDRCRTQLKLVADMERKWSQMVAIVDRYRKK